jgi:hypothetical protein
MGDDDACLVSASCVRDQFIHMYCLQLVSGKGWIFLTISSAILHRSIARMKGCPAQTLLHRTSCYKLEAETRTG